MNTIQVKPHPTLDPAAWPLIEHPASGGLLDANKKVPPEGRPWLNDGFTARMLTDGVIVRVEGDPPIGFTAWAMAQVAPPSGVAAAATPAG